jgi:hypothetical protein
VFALIGWIGRFLLILFVVRWLVSLFTPRTTRPTGARPGPRPAPRPASGERVGGQLVRCAQCGTYVPETTAITAAVGADVRTFCSGACRQQFAAAATPAG